MYSEIRDRNREGWRYTYKGSDLATAAKAKVDFYTQRESELRTRMGKMLADQSIAINNSRMNKVKQLLENAAMNKEQCEVFAHEFNRTPDREFSLSMGDVVFFGLAGHKIAVEEDEEN